MIGSKQIDKIICIACNTLIGEHTKNGLARCLFRVQGTLIAEGEKQAIEEQKKKVVDLADEMESIEQFNTTKMFELHEKEIREE